MPIGGMDELLYPTPDHWDHYKLVKAAVRKPDFEEMKSLMEKLDKNEAKWMVKYATPLPGWLLISDCALGGSVECTQYFIDRFSPINEQDYSGYSPLMLAAMSGNTDVVKLLLDNYAEIKVVDEYGWTAVMGAANHGHTAVVELLLDKGADHSVVSNVGSTALIYAAEKGHPVIMSQTEPVNESFYDLLNQHYQKVEDREVCAKLQLTQRCDTGSAAS